MSHRRILVPFATLAMLGALVATPASALAQAACGVDSDELGNGGFESPGVPANDIGLFTPAEIVPWQTTDSWVEVWGDGFQGVPAFEGVDFAEINANIAGTLYQDVVTTPGTTMTWTLAHRGRSGDDTMRVLIGDATVADVNSDNGWNSISADLVDGNQAWGVHTGDYVVPDGQTCTRFAFRAVASANGDPSFGNLLDAISFAIPVDPTDPPPAPTEIPTQPPTDTVADQTAGTSLAAGLVPLLGIVLAGAVLTIVGTRRRRGG